PAASLPLMALNSGACVIEINPASTPLSELATFSLQATAAEALTAINTKLASCK
ncbi:MAG: NAD-dependent protein deacylase, partial [Xanthomonadales bacterium]|nr:NAD-dependent protein deacylase [Xanthomonadales bacterium]